MLGTKEEAQDAQLLVSALMLASQGYILDIVSHHGSVHCQVLTTIIPRESLPKGSLQA